MKQKNNIIWAAMLAASVQAVAQTSASDAPAGLEQSTVSGIVTDAATGELLVGARIQAYNNPKYVAMTDEEGRYSITLPKGVTSLYVTYVGSNPVQVALAGRTENVNVNMYSTAFGGNYVASTSAFRSNTINASGLTADVSIDNQVANNMGAHVLSTTRGGVAGAGYNMLIGGINSLSAGTQPLVVIDGVIQDMQYDRMSIHDGFFNNLLANVSVEDIASVSVLRNGTAIYGAQGANGVILITTKRSRSMATRIDVSLGFRYELVPDLPTMMNASQYRTYASELVGTTNTKLTNFKFLRDDPEYYYYPMYHNNTDWTDLTYRNALTQNYGINVQGGDDIASYNLSVGYANANNTLEKNGYNRFNLRLNSDIKLADKVSMRFDASYSDVNRTMRDDGAPASITDGTPTAPGFLSLVKSPFLSPYAIDAFGHPSAFLAGADDFLDQIVGEEASLSNPLAILERGEADNKNSFGNRMISITAMPKWDVNKHLSVSEMFNFSMFNTDATYYLPVEGTPTFEVDGIGEVTSLSKAISGRQFLTTSDTRIAWNNRYNNHCISLFGGFRYRSTSYDMSSMQGYDSGNDKLPNMSASLNYKSTDGVSDQYTSLTWYAQAAYNWRERYYLDAGLSMQASSQFGADTNAGLKLCGVPWALFPSVSASWVVSNESWFPATNGINYARLNVGFDVSGNDNVSSNASRTWFKATKLRGEIGGTVLGNVGNTDLRWETTRRVTYGFDLNMVDNRISVSANFFNSRTTNLLSMQSLAYVTGMSQNWGNGGELKNHGFDISLSARLLNRGKWRWEMGASVGHYVNEVTKLASGNFTTDVYGGTMLTQVGGPVGLFYGYKTTGVFATTADAQAADLYVEDEAGRRTAFSAGDMHFADLDGNHVIDENDRTVIGNPNPDAYGNIFTNLQWQRLRLGVTFRYSIGGDIYNYQRSIIEGGSNFYNQSTAMGRRWTTEGQQTDIPRAVYGDPMGNSRFSDRWIEDGSYLKLANVTLSYELPIDNRYIQGFTVWASASNLFTVTRYLGADPETSISSNILMQGVDRGLLSAGRNFSLGVKINL